VDSNPKAITLAIISLPVVVIGGAVVGLSATVTMIVALVIAGAIYFAGSKG
jgi:hypothetical protein